MAKKTNKNFADLKTLYKREKLLVTSNIVVLTVTFFILGIFLTMAVGFQTAIKNLEEQAQVTLFFKDEFLEPQILQLKGELEADERILSVNYISKEDAFSIFTDINRDEPILLEAISKDILPASLEIRTEKLVSLSEVAEQYQGAEGVEEVKFFRDVVESFKFWANIAYGIGFALVAIFTLLSLSIVFATLRISIGSKSDEIEILTLVGATDEYIAAPFRFQGISFGILSGLLGALLLVIVFALVPFLGLFTLNSSVVLVPGLRVTYWAYLIILAVLLPLLGWVLGFIGSNVAVKKYLNH